jgi:hypothetical protein
VAFPGTYNFNYYRGDTYEFKVYPRTADGASFSLSGFLGAFRISTVRGSTSQTIGYAEISGDNTHISCAITPDMTLPAGATLVYDVEIRKQQDTPYSLVYTLLTGTISITEQITFIPLSPPILPPGTPNDVTASVNSQTSITVNWSEPTTGGQTQNYIVGYALADTPNTIIGTVTKTGSEFTHTFATLTADTDYIFGVSATNVASPLNPPIVTVAASTFPEPPGPPTDFAVNPVTDTTITITWEAPTEGGHTSYEAKLDGNLVANLGPLETTYTYEGLTPGTQYVVSLNARNLGGPSTAVSQTVSTQE